ncbi:UNVERIFIED_CONTAM: hypothetical protein FKN15_026805 [Acipenser sinensis]
MDTLFFQTMWFALHSCSVFELLDDGEVNPPPWRSATPGLERCSPSSLECSAWRDASRQTQETKVTLPARQSCCADLTLSWEVSPPPDS